MNQTAHDQKVKSVSQTQWHAFVTIKDGGLPLVISKDSQKELKAELNSQQNDVDVHSIVRGKPFKIKVQKSFEFVGNDEVESISN